ncbi:MAG: TatD family hydrolase [archaeon]
MLIDTHAHLTLKNFNKDRETVIQRARQKLEFVVEVGVNFLTNEKALALASSHADFIHPSLGLHPMDSSPEEVEKVSAQIMEHKDQIISVGEIGLDYHHEKDEKNRAAQRETFSKILALCEKLQKPVVTHTREAEKDSLEVLSSYKLKSVIMHCFSNNALAGECLDRGYWISVPTTVCFAQDKQELAKAIGLERLLLETDAPFLSPIRASRNEPIYVEKSAMKISQVLNTTFENVSSRTTQNAKEAFNFKAYKAAKPPGSDNPPHTN